MAINPDATFSRGDVLRRLNELQSQVTALSTARRLEAATIGAGGMRVKGGALRAQDATGDDMFRVGGDPGELFLRSDLLSPFAVAVLSDRLYAATVVGTVSTTSTSYVDLDGPDVPGVPVSASGRALVLVGGLLTAEQTGDGSTQALMAFEVSGATQRDPVDMEARSQLTRLSGTGGTLVVDTSAAGVNAVLVEGLSEGAHTFSARYRSFDGDTVEFSNRSLVVLAL